MTPLELALTEALGRLHCGALCMGSKDFDQATWDRDVARAGNVLVHASREKAGIVPATREKECSRCHESWPLDSEFFRQRTGKPGQYLAWCHACEKEDQQERRAAKA